MKKSIKSISLFVLTILFLSSYTLNFGGYQVKADTSMPGVSYQGHVQNIGWQNPVQNGEDAGTQGKGLRLEALEINLKNAPANAHIKYQGHVQNKGWQDIVQDGVAIGSHGEGLRLEALKITLENLPGYSIQYRAHVQNIGWQDWVTNGALAGTMGKSLRIEAVEIRIIPNIPSTSIGLNKSSGSLAIGQTDTLVTSITPYNSTDAIKWTSTNSAVASVDELGKVTGKVVGTSTIVASTDSGFSASCTYTVTTDPIPVTKIKLSKNTDTISLRTADTLTATITPTNATNKNIDWVSSNPSVATVSNGVVTAGTIGVTTITAINSDSGQSDTCIVTVTSIAVTSIRIKATSTIGIGGVDILDVTFTPTTATNQNIRWTSSNSSVVSVDGNGVVTGISKGAALITAISEDSGKIATCTVTVAPNSVTNVSLSQTTANLISGTSLTLTPTIVPDNATTKTILWTTSNSSVATVSGGVVYALGAGNATITATSLDGAHTATCAVTVISNPNVVTKIVISGSPNLVNHLETLSVGGVDALTASVFPVTANQAVTWTSSNNSIVQVSGSGANGTSGNLSGINPGVATITAYSVQTNSIVDQCSVVVVANPVMATTLNLNQSTYTLPLQSTYKLIPTIGPSTTTNKNVIWTSSNPSVASVDNTGTVAGLKIGTATIKATSVSNPAVFNTCSITVVPIAVANLTLNKYSDTLLVGQTDTLIVGINPTNATNQAITWSSTNSSVISVDTTGNITANAPGAAKIIATSTDSAGVNKTVFCYISVSANPYLVTGITLTNTSASLAINATTTITATVNPTTATNKNVIWTCSDPNVLAFNVTGNTITLTGVSSGSATITVTSVDNPTISQSFTITVP
jgi:uncharacterized protein YjdB